MVGETVRKASAVNCAELPTKKSLTKGPAGPIVLSGTNKSFIRGATLIYGALAAPYAWQDTNISPATHVCPHVMEYSARCAFDHALGGPL
jgi:hypothetical protein